LIKQRVLLQDKLNLKEDKFKEFRKTTNKKLLEIEKHEDKLYDELDNFKNIIKSLNNVVIEKDEKIAALDVKIDKMINEQIVTRNSLKTKNKLDSAIQEAILNNSKQGKTSTLSEIMYVYLILLNINT